MFTKSCLILILAVLAAILIDQRSRQVVHAQAGIEYKVVNAEVYLTPDGRETNGGQNSRYVSTQDVLNEYGKSGWQLISAYYDFHFRTTDPRALHLIFMRK
jgi:Domain of unknown function (DUF4177)